jgi:hypothetical protein
MLLWWGWGGVLTPGPLIVAGSGTALKDARPLQFALQIGSSAPRFAALEASLTAAPAPAPDWAVPDPGGIVKETVMTIISAVPGGSGDSFSRLVAGLQMEFGAVDVGALARSILESEKADFHWEGRVRERYLGQHVALGACSEDLDEELARIAILSFVAGRWNAGVCLVDGEGFASDLLWLRSFERREDAEEAFANAR